MPDAHRCRLAVADPIRGAEKLSSTIRIFSASLKRRRRPVFTISSRSTRLLSVRISIPTVCYQIGRSSQGGSQRRLTADRPTPERGDPPQPKAPTFLRGNGATAGYHTTSIAIRAGTKLRLPHIAHRREPRRREPARRWRRWPRRHSSSPNP